MIMKVMSLLMRKIALITATRAEWYLLERLAKNLEADDEIELGLFITGAHLSEAFGATGREFEEDFKRVFKIPILQEKDDSLSLCGSFARAVEGFSRAFLEFQPDIVVLLGDRYEMMSVGCVVLMMHLPLAHLCGGELTLGAMDEGIRHSLSKMAHLHFVSTATYKKRLMQLGEEKKRIFNVGSLSGENVKTLKLLSKKELEEALNFKLKDFFLITYHSETLNLKNTQKEVEKLLKVLDKIQGANLLFTKANADEGGLLINTLLKTYCEKNSHKARLFDNLGALKYLSALKYARAVVGNSSSGLGESIFFKTPCINIGSRQEGRLRGRNVIDCKMKDLKKAFLKLDSREFQKTLKYLKNPFASKKMPSKIIKEILKKADLKDILKKKFVDL